ncbi:hypothetical protein GLOIN_2v3502 [Rhizophagus irregularis DAOM 181602=DAOM 197198]|nr:hypothetical protein GLOIN_2v3502 [Rhizophagus irregularis DAOM 181602=DAOM 197198]
MTRDSGTATYQKTCHKRVQQFLKKAPDRFKSKLVTMRSTSNYVRMTNKENEINNDKSKVSFLLVQVTFSVNRITYVFQDVHQYED